MKKLILNVVAVWLLIGCMAGQQVTATQAPTEGLRQSPLAECPCVKSPGNWERYRSNSMENLIVDVSQVSYPSTETDTSFYIETDNAYQFPSCIRVSYENKYQEISEPRKTFFNAWSSIFGENQQRVLESMKHEVLFTENGKEYWIPVHEPLIPYLQEELAPNTPVTIFIVWAGTVFVDKEADQIFIIGEFAKDE